MDWEALSAIAEIVGVVLVIVSLVYLATQVRQSNKMALAESERDLLAHWVNAVSGISEDDRTADIWHRGMDDFDSLSNIEKTRFTVILTRLINVYISALRMESKSLVGKQEVDIFGDVCLAMILTPGGRQWWRIMGPYFTIHDLINARISKEGDHFPSWVDMVPFSRPEPADEAGRP